MRTRFAGIAVCLAVLLSPPPAFAETKTGCDSFLWPLATEIAWFQAETSVKTASGTTLAAVPSDEAVALELRPMPEAGLPLKPTSTPKPDDAQKFGGYVTIESFPGPGAYQIAISDSGWLDVGQNGTTLEAIAHTGSHHCDKLRKSVRFEIGAGPVSIQVSGVPQNTIKIAIRPAAD